MSLVCDCANADFSALSDFSCIEDVGVPVKLILQKTLDSSGAENTITPANLVLKATWTDGLTPGSGLLETNTDDTCVITPIMHGVEQSGGEVRTYGGGNQTFGGIPIVRGSEFMNFSGEFLRLNQKTVSELKDFSCYDGNLSAYWIFENGQIGVLVDDYDTPTAVKGIPIRSWFVGDKMFGQRDGIDKNMVTFSTLEDQFNLFKLYTPTDFDALTLTNTP